MANVNYVREQKSHSIMVCIFTMGYFGFGLFLIPYYTFSKNHYWKM